MRCLMVRHNASLALHENEKHIKVSCRCKAQFCQNSECKSRIWFLCPFLISYTNWHNHSLAPSRGRKKKTTTSSRIFRFVTDRWVGNCKTMMRLGRVQRVTQNWLQRARVEPALLSKRSPFWYQTMKWSLRKFLFFASNPSHPAWADFKIKVKQIHNLQACCKFRLTSLS